MARVAGNLKRAVMSVARGFRPHLSGVAVSGASSIEDHGIDDTP